jgi:B-box zinc finger
MRLTRTGTCYLCNQTFNHRSIKKHIEKCIKNHTLSQSKENIFLIKIYCSQAFWLFIEIKASASLSDLDDYLRTIWLECCGHLSQFTILSQRYTSIDGMNQTIDQILDVSTSFDYEYDFGDTTKLEGIVISSYPGQLENQIRLIARNHLPAEIVCENCEKQAAIICKECEELVCEECKENHSECEEDDILPVINSPRMGICGYCGPNL